MVSPQNFEHFYCVCVYGHVHVSVYACRYMCMYVCVCTQVYMCMKVFVCIYVCMYYRHMCLFVCVCTCRYVCVCVCQRSPLLTTLYICH